MLKKYIFHIFLFLSFGAFAQDFPKSNDFTPYTRYIDIDTVRMELAINPFEKSVSGVATISFKNRLPRIDSFFIHAVDFNLMSVLLNGEKVRYKYLQKGGMWIYPRLNLSEQNSLEIKYSAYPKKGLFFVGWDDETGKRLKQIWTQGQGIDNRYWFPSYDLQDEKAIYDIKVVFPKDYNLLASGELLDTTTDSSNITWHYRTVHPMSSYLVMLAGGEYQYVSNKSDDIDFQYWYYSGMMERVKPTYVHTEEIMRFFEKEIGVKYPWEKYAQIPVSDFKHGAMENTEATIFSDFYFCNDTSFVDQSYVSVNAHELAHQWFGDALTCSSSKHHWLHEGFATFYQLKSIEKFIGESNFIWEKKEYRDHILKISKRDSLPVAHPKAGTERFYYKGAFVLMMLEQKVGVDNFRKAIKKYTESNLYGIVETDTLKSSFENTLNINLDSFFDQWIYGNGEPEINIEYFEADKKKGIVLSQVGKIFDVEIPFVINSPKEQKEIIVDLTTAVDTLFFEGKINFFEVDPSVESLAKFKITKPISQWKKQLFSGSTCYTRWLAVTKIKKLSEKEKIKVYKKIDFKNENYKVLAEVYAQMNTLKSKSALRYRNKILETKNTDLIKEIIPLTKTINSEESEYFEEYLNVKSYLIIASSLDLLCKSFPENADKYLAETKSISGATIPFVKLSWLKNAVMYGDFSLLEKKQFSELLVSYTSKSYGFNTRLYALNHVFEISYFNRTLLLNLINGSVSFNHHLVRPYRQVMSELVKNDSFRNELKSILENEKLTQPEAKYLRGILNL